MTNDPKTLNLKTLAHYIADCIIERMIARLYVAGFISDEQKQRMESL